MCNPKSQLGTEWGTGQSAPVTALAKGHARQMVINMRDRLVSNLSTMSQADKTRSRKKNYDLMVGNYCRAYEGLIIDCNEVTKPNGKIKDKYWILVVVLPSENNANFIFSEIIIRYRNPAIVEQCIYNIKITEHAMHRLMQRMPSSGEMLHQDVLDELAVLHHWFRQEAVSAGLGTFEIGTGRGMGVFVLEETSPESFTMVLLTWVDRSKLRPDQPFEELEWQKISN